MAQQPANVRISAQFPFPAGVAGAAPVKIVKANGIWTISIDIASLGAQAPPAQNFATDYLFVYDTVAATFFKMSLSALVAAIAAQSSARAQRLASVSPIVIAAADQIINVNIGAGAPTCTLPQASTRAGLPLTFKDVGANFAAHALTITPFAGDSIDGTGVPLVLNAAKQSITLVPANDGTSIGWNIE